MRELIIKEINFPERNKCLICHKNFIIKEKIRGCRECYSSLCVDCFKDRDPNEFGELD